MTASALLFYGLSLIILSSAVMMVFSKNLIHSALFMIVTFLGVAGLYLTLAADFLAMAQIVIYVGAISVLLIFGVMLTRRSNIKESNLFTKYKYPAGIVAAALFLTIAHFEYWAEWKVQVKSVGEGTTARIADLLLNNYAISFEISGILLLVALIGAIVIGKGEGNTK